MSKRELFLFWLLAGLLFWQAAIFTFGTAMCARSSSPREMCPELGQRYESFVQTRLMKPLDIPCFAGEVPTAAMANAAASVTAER